MVRTKQPRKTRSMREATEECDSLVKDFERQSKQRLDKVEADLSMQISMLANSIEVVLAGLPTEIRKLKLGELLTLDTSHEEELPMETTDASSEISTVSKATLCRPKKAAKRATVASDDGYATESTTARTTHVSRMNSTRNSVSHQPRKHRSSSNGPSSVQRPTRITRSTSRNRNSKMSADAEQENRSNLLKSTSRCPIAGKYKTPSTKNQAPSYGVITPKIKPNIPLNMMRRPRQGEMVLSMQGSPLLVSTVEERTANINVPLRNGDIISLLPNPGLRLSHLPAVDDETMRQLRTLNGHLNKVMGHK